MTALDRVLETQLARVLGLEAWKQGRNRLRRGEGEEPAWVDLLWRFDVHPSFEPLWALAGFSARTGADQSVRACRVAWLPEADQVPRLSGGPSHAVAVEVPSVPLLDALNAVDLLDPEPRPVCLDGISYALTFESGDIFSGGFHFANPRRDDLVRVERAALETARLIAEETDSPALKRCLDLWKTFAVREGP